MYLIIFREELKQGALATLGGGGAGFGQFLVTGVVCGLGSMDLAAEELELEAGGARARARGRGGRS
jgi:hypothetical protein